MTTFDKLSSAPADGATLTGSTNNTVVTVTGSNTIQGEANLLFDGNLLALGNDIVDAFLTVGIILNQGANDDNILSLKSSDVAHGMTNVQDTDTYGALGKVFDNPLAGGLVVIGLTETDIGVEVDTYHTNDDTAKNTTARGSFVVKVQKKNGTGAGSAGADANLMVILNSGTARFIFDAEGEGHADIAWSTYDDKNDIELLRGLHGALVPGFTESFGKDMEYNLKTYEDLGIVGKDSVHVEHREDGRVQFRGMVNMTKLSMLHHSTMIQMHDRYEAKFQAQEERLQKLERELIMPKGKGYPKKGKKK